MAAQIIDLQKYRQARIYRHMAAVMDDYEFAEELALLADVFENKALTSDYGSRALQGLATPGG